MRRWLAVALTGLLIAVQVTACSGQARSPVSVAATLPIVEGGETEAIAPTVAATSTQEPTPLPTQPPTGASTLGAATSQAEEAPAGRGGPSFTPIRLGAPDVIYPVQKTDRLPPEDVFREVDYSGGAGGSGDPCAHQPKGVPMLFDPTAEYEWDDLFSQLTCQWAPGETIRFELVSPQSEVLHAESGEAAQENGDYHASWKIPINTAPGRYLARFSGREETLEHEFAIIVPSEPRLYELYVDQKTFLALYNFQPHEAVRLLIYGVDYKANYLGGYARQLFDWQEYETDENGQTVIEVDFSGIDRDLTSDLFMIVVGEQTGEVHPHGFRMMAVMGHAVSPFGMKVFRPTETDYNRLPVIWDRIGYRDLYQPGEQTYDFSVEASEETIWRFSWCASDIRNLSTNESYMNIEFIIDGEKVPFGLIGKIDYDSRSGWKCRRWVTKLAEWEPGREHTLEIRQTIQEEIFDGERTYPAGVYRQVITMQVR